MVRARGPSWHVACHRQASEVQIDDTRSYSGTIKKRLEPGEYDIKFLVKDRSDGRVVLHNDMVNFEVTND